MRLVVALALSLALVPAALAAESSTAAAPAAAQAPVTPPVRFDWQGVHKKAQAALAQHDYKTAIQLFTDVIDSGRLPRTWVAPTFYLRGKAYRSAKKYDQAIADYQKATEADPKMDIAYYEMGAAYQELNQHAKAIDAFSKAIAIKSNNAGYFYARCVSESWISRFADATRDCHTASQMKPGDADMLATLGRLYEDQGRKADAIATYKAALAINPSQSEAKEGLAFLEKRK
ncbi:MAG: tetratricopeptide repeat protein [Alphaproteobacteria bacterium]|nr:tetratricopeptide repeat protein [Alphaproteobacteria bacterium]